MPGFENYSVEILEITRDRLLAGLTLVANSLDKEEFHTVGPKGEAPPSQSGQLTLILLQEIEAELVKRLDPVS